MGLWLVVTFMYGLVIWKVVRVGPISGCKDGYLSMGILRTNASPIGLTSVYFLLWGMLYVFSMASWCVGR